MLLHGGVSLWEYVVGVEFQRMWEKTFNGQDGSVNVGHGALWLFF